MSDMIYRETARRIIDSPRTKEQMLAVLAGVRSVQPEIIMCKDCKYYREYGYVNGKPKFLPRCTFNSIYVNADDFCSKAERRGKAK